MRDKGIVVCVKMLELFLPRMSLDLVETLLNIAETGNFDEVLQLFGAPLKQCPEILFFGLLQAKVCMNLIVYCFIVYTIQAKVVYSKVYRIVLI